MKNQLLIIFFLLAASCTAQINYINEWKDPSLFKNEVKIGKNMRVPTGKIVIGKETADASALLEVSGTKGGFLIPRMTQTQRISIVNPAQGLLVYETDADEGFWYCASGGVWIKVGGGSYTLTNGDATSGFENNKLLFIESGVVTHSPIGYDMDGLFIGQAGTTDGSLRLYYTGNSYYTKILPSVSPENTMSWDFYLPPDNGESGYILTTDGDGNTSWEAAGLEWSDVAPTGNDYRIPYNLSGTLHYLADFSFFDGSPSEFQIPSDGIYKIGGYNIAKYDIPNNWLEIGNGGMAVRISDAYTLPNADGSANQVLMTDGSGNVDWESRAVIYDTTVTIISDSILTAYDFPDTIIPSPGSGFALELISVTGRIAGVTTDYATQTGILLQFPTATKSYYSDAKLLDATVDKMVKFNNVSISNATDTQILENKPLVFTTGGAGNATLGDGDLTIYITYRKIQL
ncbi:MAG: hypothetical protein AB7G44_04990 [Bacteroidia bacterium]